MWHLVFHHSVNGKRVGNTLQATSSSVKSAVMLTVLIWRHFSKEVHIFSAPQSETDAEADQCVTVRVCDSRLSVYDAVWNFPAVSTSCSLFTTFLQLTALILSLEKVLVTWAFWRIGFSSLKFFHRELAGHESVLCGDLNQLQFTESVMILCI